MLGQKGKTDSNLKSRMAETAVSLRRLLWASSILKICLAKLCCVPCMPDKSLLKIRWTERCWICTIFLPYNLTAKNCRQHITALQQFPSFECRALRRIRSCVRDKVSTFRSHGGQTQQVLMQGHWQRYKPNKKDLILIGSKWSCGKLHVLKQLQCF